MLLQGRKMRQPIGNSPGRPSISIRLTRSARVFARVASFPIHQATHCVWEERTVVQLSRTNETDFDPRGYIDYGRSVGHAKGRAKAKEVV